MSNSYLRERREPDMPSMEDDLSWNYIYSKEHYVSLCYFKMFVVELHLIECSLIEYRLNSLNFPNFQFSTTRI